MNLATIAVGVVVLMVLIAAAYFTYKGKCCGGCSDCKSCNGCCNVQNPEEKK